MTSAKWLIFRMSFLIAVSSSGVTRSTLFSKILSLKATCWTASLTAPAFFVVSRRGGRGALAGGVASTAPAAIAASELRVCVCVGGGAYGVAAAASTGVLSRRRCRDHKQGRRNKPSGFCSSR
jgi:hypothetical protein